MFAYTKEVENLVQRLILHITEEESMLTDVAQKCEKSAKWTLKHHRYLDVNSHAVQRTVEGLEHKFRVHNKLPEADLLVKLFDNFTQLEFEGNAAMSDFHFGCVSFLHLCAHQPTGHDFTPELQWVTQDQEDEDVKLWTDWLISNRRANGFILDDDADDDGNNQSDLSDWDCDDEVKNTSENRSKSSNRHQLSTARFEKEPLVFEASDDEATDLKSGHSSDSENSGNEVENVFSLKHVEFTFHNIDESKFYWRMGQNFEKLQRELISDPNNDENAFFSRSFVAMRSYNPLMKPVKSSSKCLTEVTIIRECIWALMSNEINVTIFIRSFDNESFIVNSDIFLTHLSFESLKRTLESVLKLRNDVTICRQLCVDFDSVVNCLALTKFTQAFRHGILQLFEEFLLKIEQKAKDDFTTYTLLQFCQELSNWKPLFAFFAVICNEIFASMQEILVFPEKELASHAISKVTLLLLKQANFILNKFLLRQSFPKFLSLKAFVNLFAAVYCSSLDIFHNWINYGGLNQTIANEFFVKRNSEVAINSSRYWKEAFSLQPETANFLSRDDCQFFIQLTDVAKSVEMLTSSEKFLPKDFPPDISEIFKKNLNSVFWLDVSENKSELKIDESKSDYEPATVAERDQSFAQSDFEQDTSTNLRNFTESQIKINESEKYLVDASIPLFKRNISRAKSSTYQLILKDLNLANGLLLSEIKTAKMELFTNGISALYLFQSNASEMHEFLFDLFEDISRKQKWKDPTMLTLKLQDVFEANKGGFQEEFYENIVASVNSSVKNDSGINQNVINQLKELVIMVNVRWPISVVFSPDVFNTLNQVFVFLSQIKWAKYSTTRLKISMLNKYFQGQKGGTSSKLMNLFYRFRFRIIHFVNVLETYFMTRIVHATHSLLNVNIKKAQTISDVMASVEEFASTLKNRCLLNAESSKVRSALMSALNTFLIFVKQSEKIIDSDADLSAVAPGIEQAYKTFDNIFSFIQSLLRKLVKRGSFQHLESLAFALS